MLLPLFLPQLLFLQPINLLATSLTHSLLPSRQVKRTCPAVSLHRGAPRAPKVRWALRWLERKRLMAEILRGMQLMHLYLMLDAFNPILSTAVLEAKDLPPCVVFSLLFPCVGKLKIAGIIKAVSRAMECYFQRRKVLTPQRRWRTVLAPRRRHSTKWSAAKTLQRVYLHFETLRSCVAGHGDSDPA